MRSDEIPQLPSDDRDVPKAFAGKLEPNYFCRGWNAKSEKYCRAKAGQGTTHPGVGRCKFHGGLQDGDGRLTNGARSVVKKSTLRALVEQEKGRTDPLDLTEELAILRALRQQLLAGDDDDQVNTAAAQQLLDGAGRMVERIERIRSQNAISRPELNRIMQEMWRAVDGFVTDDEVKGKIRENWMRIAL
jgi:hypothetical protein